MVLSRRILYHSSAFFINIISIVLHKSDRYTSNPSSKKQLKKTQFINITQLSIAYYIISVYSNQICVSLDNAKNANLSNAKNIH